MDPFIVFIYTKKIKLLLQDELDKQWQKTMSAILIIPIEIDLVKYRVVVIRQHDGNYYLPNNLNVLKSDNEQFFYQFWLSSRSSEDTPNTSIELIFNSYSGGELYNTICGIAANKFNSTSNKMDRSWIPQPNQKDKQ